MNYIRATKFICLLLVFFSLSCKSKKSYNSSKKQNTSKVNRIQKLSPQVKNIINYAKTFKGTPYKYGGDNKRGMDCSGLVHTAFTDNNISVPRTTVTLSKHGKWIDLKKVQPGDLVFFATKKNSRNINHVGIVTYARAGHVEFIHASSSKGVIVSSLANKYWYFAYVQARRVI